MSNSGMSSGFGGQLSRNDARFITNDMVPETPQRATNKRTENLFIFFCFLIGLCEENVDTSRPLPHIYNVHLLHKSLVIDKNKHDVLQSVLRIWTS